MEHITCTWLYTALHRNKKRLAFETFYTPSPLPNAIDSLFLTIFAYSVSDYENKTCVPCEANCASCQDRPDYCTSCDHHLVMHEHRCYSACPAHTYETEDYQ